MEDGYAFCLNKWALDGEIKTELGLLIIISSLCAEKGYCFATNKYLADLFNITEVSLSNKIKKLEKKGYISIEYERRGCEVISRRIRLKNILIDDYKKVYSTIKKDFKEKNTIIKNNINNNINIIERDKTKRFIRPSLEEIEDYCKERNNDVDAKKFYEYYEVNDWKDRDGNQVKNWKQKVITWEGRGVHQVTKIETTPDWFDKDLEINKASIDERKEMEEILNSYWYYLKHII